MTDLTFVFVRTRFGRQLQEFTDVDDWSFDDETGVLTVEHTEGPRSEIHNVISIDSVYRDAEAEYVGP